MYKTNRILLQNFFFLFAIFIYIIIYIITNVKADSKYDLDINIGAPRMIKRAGYPAESHFVITEDGYIIEMHRIPGKNGSIPVFLQHGLFGSSNTWVLTGKNQSLAYLLADNGYDVWIGNIRGTTYGQAHINMTVNDAAFYNYSIHELGMYDLTAQILYVTNLTSKSVILIPFSMGSPMTMIMTSQHIEIQSKIRLIIHLAPAVFVRHLTETYIRIILPFVNVIEAIADFLGIQKIPPAIYLYRIITKYLCNYSKIQKEICKEIILSFVGFDNAQFDVDMVPIFINYAPDIVSVKVIWHYAQWVNSGHFRNYDYGKSKNVAIYNEATPPDYNITKVNIPNVIFYGDNDVFVRPEDAERLYQIIPNKMGIFKVNYTKFTHIDFRFAIDARTLVYNHIIEIINHYVGV